MNVRCLLSNDIASEFMGSTQPIVDIHILLDAIECMSQYSTTYFHSDAIYNIQLDMNYFADWLYSKKGNPALFDLKRELSKKIEKSRRIEDTEYIAMMNCIFRFETKEGLLLSLCKMRSDGLFIWTKESYFDKKRWYLEKQTDRCDFVREAVECFPNIFFHENVGHSLNMLNADYNIEKPYIIAHLKALDDFHPLFFSLMKQGFDFRRICQEFMKQNVGIECSPQSDRNSAKKLNFLFETENNDKKILLCELHTKLKWRGMNHGKQDRIYFHPGDKSIANGKVLVVHIGTHL